MVLMARNFYLGSEAVAAVQQCSLRKDAHDRARREARLFLSTEGPHRSFRDILARLDRVIADGRREFAARGVAAKDIEAWDTSCRIMFLLNAWHHPDARNA